MIVRPARMADVDLLLDWRRERAEWLADRGEDQWQVPWPRWAVGAAVQAGQTWMVQDGEDPVATITLTAAAALDDIWKSDKGPGLNPDLLWHPEDEPGDALYVTKLMVPCSRAGDGIGAELLDWAGGLAHEAEVSWLRLDVWTTNLELQAWYVRQGFTHVRTVASRTSGACFQRASSPYRGWRLKTEI